MQYSVTVTFRIEHPLNAIRQLAANTMEQRVLRRRFSPFCRVESATRASQRKPRIPADDDEIGTFIVIARTLLCPRDVRRPATLFSMYFVVDRFLLSFSMHRDKNLLNRPAAASFHFSAQFQLAAVN